MKLKSKSGLASQEELLKKEVEDKVIEPTEKEIGEMYEQFKDRLQGMDFTAASPLIREQLLRQKQGERFQVYLEELKTKHNVKITLPYPDLPRQQVSADDDPFLGTDGAYQLKSSSLPSSNVPTVARLETRWNSYWLPTQGS